MESDEAFATVQAVQDVAARHYGTFYTAGQSANLYDMKNIVAVDNVVVSGIAVVAILCVLLVTFRSIALPLVLLLTIESGIWINLSIPYFTGEPVNFIGYLVINTVQLGATIDYGILLTTHYLDHRRREPARQAIRLALGETFPRPFWCRRASWRRRASRFRSRRPCQPWPAWAFCSGAARFCPSPS